MTGPRVIPISAQAETEKGFQGWVLEYATLMGWESHHQRWSIQSASGWPDLVLCRPPRLVIAELKTARGKLSTAQDGWLERLGRCAVEVYLWRPSDRDRIVVILGPDDQLAASIAHHPSRQRP